MNVFKVCCIYKLLAAWGVATRGVCFSQKGTCGFLKTFLGSTSLNLIKQKMLSQNKLSLLVTGYIYIYHN